MSETLPFSMPESSQAVIKKSTVDTNAGLGLFAKVDLIPGDVIHHVSEPLAAVSDANPHGVTCAYCFNHFPHDMNIPGWIIPKELPKPIKCSGCNFVSYCNNDCQENDWSKGSHKLECKFYQAIQAQNEDNSIIDPTFRLVAQVALKYQENGPEWKMRKAFNAMANPSLEKFPYETRQKFFAYGALFNRFAKFKMNYNEFLRLVSRAATNPQVVLYKLADEIGIYLDPSLFIINHSCRPNAWVRFEGRKASLIALRPLMEGEEITVSYVPPQETREMRQKMLQQRYFFECRCPKCLSSEISLTKDQKIRRAKAVELSSLNGRSEAATLYFNAAEYSTLQMSIDCLGTKWPVQIEPYPSIRGTLAFTSAIRGQWSNKGWIFHMKDLLDRVYPRFYAPEAWDPERLNAMYSQFLFAIPAMDQNPPATKAELIQITRILARLIKELKKNVPIVFGDKSKLTQEINKEFDTLMERTPSEFHHMFR